MAIQQSAPSHTNLGARYSTIITVTNTGAAPIGIGDLTLQSELPAGVTFLGANDAIAAGLVACGFSGGPPAWTNANPLLVGASCALNVQVQVNADASLCEKGLLVTTATAALSSPAAAAAQASSLTQVQCAADVSITQSGPPSLTPGGTGSFTLTMTNHGPDPACGVEIQALPQNAAPIVLGVSGDVAAYAGGGRTWRRTACLPAADGANIDTLTIAYRLPTDTPAAAMQHC
ncbi:MAG: hypothetical protein R2911_45085, partial [Caldilineaceae bacterium]